MPQVAYTRTLKRHARLQCQKNANRRWGREWDRGWESQSQTSGQRIKTSRSSWFVCKFLVLLQCADKNQCILSIWNGQNIFDDSNCILRSQRVCTLFAFFHYLIRIKWSNSCIIVWCAIRFVLAAKNEILPNEKLLTDI